jgi:starvation-inducible DNA-binding protein
MSTSNTANDLPRSVRTRMMALLQSQLADAIDLHYQAKQAHWNVKGPSFMTLHELFDKVAETADAHVDLIAERIVQLGGVAEGTVRAAAKGSSLAEYPKGISAGLDHCKALTKAMAAFGKAIRAAIDAAAEAGDAGTADLFTEVSRDNDKNLWFVEAHLHASA